MIRCLNDGLPKKERERANRERTDTMSKRRFMIPSIFRTGSHETGAEERERERENE